MMIREYEGRLRPGLLSPASRRALEQRRERIPSGKPDWRPMASVHSDISPIGILEISTQPKRRIRKTEIRS